MEASTTATTKIEYAPFPLIFPVLCFCKINVFHKFLFFGFGLCIRALNESLEFKEIDGRVVIRVDNL